MFTIKTTPKTLTVFFVYPALTIIAYMLWIFPNTGLSIQLRNMKKAKLHSVTISAGIHADPRFQDVTLGPFTGGNGSLMESGRVPKEADIIALKSIIESNRCPVRVVFSLWELEWTNRTNAAVQQCP